MKPALKIPAVGLLLVAILWLFEAQFHFFRSLMGGEALGQRELATLFLGQHLAEHCPGRNVLVLSNPFSQKKDQPRHVYQFEKAGLNGLRRGVGASVKIEAVVFPELKPEFFQNPALVFIDPATTTPLSYLVAEDALDKIAKEHPAADIYVSLIGLPVHIRKTEAWKQKHFALLLPDLRFVGDRATIVQAVKSRTLEAMILNKPGAPPEDQPLGRDLAMEFDRRFLLITAETIDAALKSFPNLLPNR
jgi:hypothetical protein